MIENLEEIILKLIDRFPTWYLMVIITILILYKIITKICDNNAKIIIKLLSKWNARTIKREEHTKKLIDEFKNEINQKIENIYNLLKNRE